MRIFTQLLKSGVQVLLLLLAQTAASQTWTRTPTPDPSASRNMLRGISGTSAADLWAVGSYDTSTGGSANLLNLVLHYDGTSWQQVAAPRPAPTSTIADLWDVAALSPTDAWAVGHYAAAGIGSRAQLLHWNGTAWQFDSFTHPAQSFLWAMDATAATDVWAVGGYVNPAQPSILEQSYVLHHNGQQWAQQPTPIVGTYRNRLSDVDALTPADVWAVGAWGNNVGDFRPMLLHYDGTSWTNVAPPASLLGVNGELLRVAVVAPNDAWALGNRTAGGSIVLHYDGTAWTEAAGTATVGGAMAVLGPNDIYSTGPNISHWNGTAWTVVDPLTQVLYPSLGSTTVLPTGEVWAAGVASTSTLPFATLVMRSNTSAPQLRISGPAGTVAAGSPVQLTATASRAGTYQFRWSPATGLSNPAIANPVATLTATTTYTVTMTEPATGAVAQATVLVRVGTASATVLPTPELTVQAWPSPFGRELTCTIAAGQAAPATIVLTDALGRELSREQVRLQAGTNFLTLRPVGAPGLYLLRVRTAGHEARLRVVRE